MLHSEGVVRIFKEFHRIRHPRSLTSENYDILILMLDMSKAFHTFNRNKLMNILKSVLSDCELHMMHILINDVNLNVRLLGNNVGENITTSVAICQGDCLSALLFIVYLASSIKLLPPQIQQVNCNRPLWSALDWLIDKDKHKVEGDPKCADDITFVRTDESKINQVERLMSEMLKETNLYVNPTKTEKYTIGRTSNGSWMKKCKLLGSLLDSDEGLTGFCEMWILRNCEIWILRNKKKSGFYEIKKIWILRNQHFLQHL